MKLLDLVKEDSVIVSEPIHIYYLTGLKAALEQWEEVFTLHNPMFLGISKNESMFLLAGRSSLANPFLIDELVFDSKSLFEGNLWTYGDYNLDERVVPQMDFVAEELSEVMAEMKSRAGFELGKVGVEEWHVQHEVTARLLREFPSIKFSGISAALRRIRAVKDETEIKCIREGIGRLRFVLQNASSLTIPGQSELQALENLSRSFKSEYGEEASLSGQVLSGSRTSEVFGKPTGKKLEGGERVILDLLTSVGGYWARASGTLRVGKRLESEAELEKGILDALAEGSRALSPGRKAAEVFVAISERITGVRSSSGLLHEAGHGVGLEVREAPFLIPGSVERIEEGMVCSLTAGRYDPLAGGARFSECYLVGKNGSSVL